MSDVIVRAESLGKRYRIRSAKGNGYTSLREALMNAASDLARRVAGDSVPTSAQSTEEFWALKNASFEVRRGEVVGIIGRNGAGKSTLLKILSRITEPSSGRVILRGRVASLLEVGTGFHPELTGRENIFLNGAILGMSRVEIRSRFDEIVQFAEVERFLDTPVKRYSSGMHVRLAFSIAAHLEPELLVVDEVLAVGDADFRKRCLGKMRAVSSTEGRTVLFVSHDMSAIQTLCERSILLHEGSVRFDGSSKDCISTYFGENASHRSAFERPPQASGAPTITHASIDGFSQAASVDIECTIATRFPKTISIDMRLTDQSGYAVGFGSLGTFGPDDLIRLVPGNNRIKFRVHCDRLAVGTYYVSLDLTVPDSEYFDRLESGLEFEVTRPPPAGRTRVLNQSWGYGASEVPLSHQFREGAEQSDVVILGAR